MTQVSTKKNCGRVSDYPFIITNSFGALVANKAVICGGNAGAVVTSVCYAYDPNNNAWDYAGAMAQERTRAAAATMSGDKMLVAGGKSGENLLKTTEIFDGSNFAAGPDIPVSVTEHCLVRLAGEKFFLAGGRTSASEASTKAWILDMRSRTWQKVPDLNIGRRNPMCGKTVDGEVFVAGGEGSAESQDSVEIFSPDTSSWRLGASIPAKAPQGKVVAFRRRFLALGVKGASLYEYIVSPRSQEHWMKRTDTVTTSFVTAAFKVPDEWCFEDKPKKGD